jgi:hypothetical protein
MLLLLLLLFSEEKMTQPGVTSCAHHPHTHLAPFISVRRANTGEIHSTERKHVKMKNQRVNAHFDQQQLHSTKQDCMTVTINSSWHATTAAIQQKKKKDRRRESVFS